MALASSIVIRSPAINNEDGAMDEMSENHLSDANGTHFQNINKLQNNKKPFSPRQNGVQMLS